MPCFVGHAISSQSQHKWRQQCKRGRTCLLVQATDLENVTTTVAVDAKGVSREVQENHIFFTLEMLYILRTYSINRSIDLTVGEVGVAFTGLEQVCPMLSHYARSYVVRRCTTVGSVWCVQKPMQCGRWLSRSRELLTYYTLSIATTSTGRSVICSRSLSV